MTTIGQIAQSYRYILEEANRTGVTPREYVENLQRDINQLESGLDSGVLNDRGPMVLGRIRQASGLGYGTPNRNVPADWRADVPDGNARTAISDFRLGLQAVQRPPFLGNNVDAYMQAVIAAAQNPAVASQPFTLDSLDSARVFSGTSAAPAPELAATADAAAPADSAASADTSAVPATATPALTTALTNFLTGGATAEEITALKGAVNIAGNDQLQGQGGANGADTLVATRTALGGALSETNHPELYTLARARYYEITGLPADRVATPDEIRQAQERMSQMQPQPSPLIAEYQSVAYLLERNETALSNGKINVDGIYGDRTATSIATVGANLLPAVTVAGAPTSEADASATTDAPAAATTTARPRVVVLDMSIEDNRGDRERLLRDVPTELQRQLNTDPSRPVTVAVFNPRDNRDGPQTLTQFMQEQGANADVVGVMSLKNDGIRGTDNDLRLTFTGRANNVPTVETTITDRGMREGMTPAITEAARTMNGMINGTATAGVNEARTFDIVSPQQARALEASLTA